MALIKGKQIASLDASKIVESAGKQFVTAEEKTAFAAKLDASKVGAANGVAGLDASGKLNATVDASKLTGTLDLSLIPHAAVERAIKVADTAARLALTTDSAQMGDTVIELDTGTMFYIVDDTQLGSEAGYAPYKASVDWSTLAGKPTSSTAEIDAAVAKAGSIGYSTSRRVAVTNGQTTIVPPISDVINSEITFSVNGYIQTPGLDYTTDLTDGVLTITWLDRSFTLEASDEVVVGCTVKA